MKKIISLFKRDYDGQNPKGLGNRLVYNEIVEGAEWVVAGEGIATRKWDGTSCLWQAGKLYKRYDAKHGKTPPAGFVAAQKPDPVTGHWPGWLLVTDKPEDRWHAEAVVEFDGPDGTYELIGPKVQGNPEGVTMHILVRHGAHELPDAPRSFDGLREYLRTANIEGIVWHHPDGRMVKIKTKDFGFSRSEPKRRVVGMI